MDRLDITELAVQPHPIHGGKGPDRMVLKVETGSNFEFERFIFSLSGYEDIFLKEKPFAGGEVAAKVLLVCKVGTRLVHFAPSIKICSFFFMSACTRITLKDQLETPFIRPNTTQESPRFSSTTSFSMEQHATLILTIHCSLL